MWHANRLGARIGNLRTHMSRLRAGELDSTPPEDRTDDEIGELREAIAEATERLAAVYNSQERMIADAAHELRTPLAALRAEIDVALRRERSAEQLRESLGHARVEVERLGTLSSHLLDLAALRASPIRRERVDMVGILVEAIDAARALAETRGCVVRLETPERAPAEIAAAALRQALDNLLSNAIKYAPPGSSIEVELRRNGAQNTWEFNVRDRGPGIPADAREAVFEPFFTVNDEAQTANQGAGLGLAIVKDTAVRHGGSVALRPRSGGGSIFTLTLPDG
ncbi:MAG: HAMP domain-containing sensor histidine kinase [Nannocystaceae bacterium]